MLHKVIISIFIAFTFQSAIAQNAKQDSIQESKEKAAEIKKEKEAKDTIPGTKGKVDIAPETKLERKESKRIYSLKQFGRETVIFLGQPTRWKTGNWLSVGAIAVGTVTLTLFDQPFRDATQGYQHYYYSAPVEGGRMYGEWYSIGAVAGTFGILGSIRGDTAQKKIAIELLQGGLYAETIVELIKIIVGRARPYENKGSGTFHPFTITDPGYNSFPSGHSTSAFTLSTIMAQHASTDVLKVLAYTPAFFTLFARIYQDKHWVSDELLGAGLGYFIGNWVVDLHEERRHRINVTALSPPTISIALGKIN